VGGPDQPPRLSYLDAAERVLHDLGVREPVSYRVITDEALSRGHLAPAGLTPSATMYAALMLDVRRRARRGDEPRFTQLPEGLFGLAAWAADDLLTRIERHNREVKATLSS
jgi:hypothetical protein